jgi:HK97 family phage major capsid protein
MAPVTTTNRDLTPAAYAAWRATHPRIAGGDELTQEELEARQNEIRGRLREIDAEHANQALPADARTEWNELNEELERNEELLGELRARRARVDQLAEREGNREDGTSFHTAPPGATRDQDIWDLSTVRSSVANPREATRELRERSLRAVEQARFPLLQAANERRERAGGLTREDIQEHLRSLLDTDDEMSDEFDVGALARRMLVTGSPIYRRAWSKQLMGRPLSADEQRALSIGVGASGGFAVPYVLDPTIIPTSNLSVNPYRAISRTIQITGEEWRGVSSAGVTANYGAEATEASDNAPTLAQPTIDVERAQVFIPFSIEVGQDWGALQAEMAGLIQDAKDDLEATKFTTGLGHGSSEPQGIITGATTTVSAGGVASFAVADVYKVEEALGPRFRPRAQWVANRFIYNKVRQFDTAGGAALWMQLGRGLANQVPTPGNTNAELIGYPANEASPMGAALTTGTKIALLGDWRYYAIVDRIGMDVELIPHLFGTNRRPTGQRGLYAFWRNSAGVLDTNAFRVLATA